MRAVRLRGCYHVLLGVAVATHVACNAAFEVRETRLVDALAPDAPHSCPTTEVPGFTGFAIEEITQYCDDYAVNARVGLAVGRCYVQTPTGGAFAIGMGAPGSPLEYAPDFDVNRAYRVPRLSPDGARLYISRGVDPAIERHHREGSRWIYDGDVAIPHGTPSAVAESTGGDVLLVTSAGSLREWEIASDGTPRERLPAHSFSTELGVASLDVVHLSPDGLRLTFNGTRPGDTSPVVLYAWRTAPTGPFSNATRLDGVPRGDSPPFMTEDCGRVYIAGLGRVFYVPRQ